MDSIQYTIRNIPKPVDEALRKRAKQQNKSFNQTIVEVLGQAAGKSNIPPRNTDLDWFIGKGSFDKSFDDAQAWLDSLPMDLQK